MRLELGSLSATISGDLDDARRHRKPPSSSSDRSSGVLLRRLAYWNCICSTLFLLFASGVANAQTEPPPTVATTMTRSNSSSSSSSKPYSEIFVRKRSAAAGRQCKLFSTAGAADALCRKQSAAGRANELRDTYLFATCTEMGELNLHTFFGFQNAPDVDIGNASLRRHTYFLDQRLDDCFDKAAHFDDCRTCYRNLSTNVDEVIRMYSVFSNMVLSKLECEPKDDVLIYSSIFNCSQCKIWYKRWLLATLKGVWTRGPCFEWCHLAELACPHLQASRRDDYAGLPSFRCTDVTIPNSNSTYRSSRKCTHPCEMWGQGVIRDHDFKMYCEKHNKQRKQDAAQKRKTKKRKQKQLERSTSNGHRTLVHRWHTPVLLTLILLCWTTLHRTPS